ncbi:ABC transporter substrate-binding protein [Paenibacillus sp. J5C_2022]|uniref:ABC transporter substrate-binding protein n=1 Tax=Paenibacillus sp. J5C2022 TaxID=2977129 RepID=UPI0021D25EEF|nr:ABC transporter substrate-binding protein [Paenibacillus sp. J5C2022]MCU6708661.1 ABC transporter substrate-binding protein [Paenibacillus sp. J5C2022]
MNMFSLMSGKKCAAVMMLMLVMVLSACTGNGVVEENGGNNSATTEAPESGKTAQMEASAAPKSDKLVVYTAGPAGMAAGIKEGFEAATGIKVEQFDGTTGKVLARLEAEKGNPVADVVILASWPSGLSLKEQGMTQSYVGAANADRLYETWVDGDKHLFGYSASALGMTYNTKLVDNPPVDWSDLAKPEWKDAVNIPDPSLSGSALDFISGYLNERGDAGWELFQSLKDNGVALAGANKEALNPVVTGAKSAVMAGVDYMAYSAIAKGEPIGIAYPASGTVINPRPAMILKDAKNVENAKLFIDYLLSDEAQKLVAEAYLLPGRSDIEAHADRVGVKDIKLLQYDWNWMTEQGEAITDKFLTMFK